MPVTGVAVAPNGTVAVVDVGTRDVTLYPKLATNGSFDGEILAGVGLGPVAIIHKQIGPKGYFAVLCRSDRTLYLLDDVTGKVTRTIKLPKYEPLGMVGAYADTGHYIYISFLVDKPRPNDPKDGVARLDLADGSDTGAIQYMGGFRQIQSSPDGEVFYQKETHVTPATLVACKPLSPEAPGMLERTQRIQVYGNNDDPAVADPNGVFIANGNEVYETASAKQAAKLPSPVVAFMVGRPVAFTYGRDGLRAYSTNTWVPCRTQPFKMLQDDPRPDPDAGNLRYEVPGRFVIAEKAGVLLHWSNKQVQRVPLGDFRLPDERPVVVTNVRAAVLEVGQAWSMPVKPAEADASVALTSAPAGASLKDGVLSWTPTAADVGTAEATLTITLRGTSRQQTIPLIIRQPSIELPLTVTAMAVSHDGRYALVATRGHGNGDAVESPADMINTRDPRVAVVDLTTRKVIADRKLDGLIGAVAVDDEFAYIAMREMNACEVLAIKDLHEVGRITTVKPPVDVVAMGQAIALASGDRIDAYYSLYDHKSLKPLTSMTARANLNVPENHPRWTGQRWSLNGVSYDASGVKVMDITRPTGILLAFENYPSLPPDKESPPSIASRVIEPCVDWPAILTSEEIKGDQGARGLKLEVRELARHEVVGKLPLSCDTQLEFSNRFAERRLITSVPGLITVLSDRRLFLVKSDALAGMKLSERMRIDAIEGPMLVPTNGRTSVRPVVKNAEGAIEYAGEGPPGVSVDPRTGEITFDPAAIVPAAVDKMLMLHRRAFPEAQTAPNPTSASAVRQYFAKDGVAEFTWITGKKPTGVPLAVPVLLTAKDSAGHAASRLVTVLIDVPAGVLADAIKATPDRRPAPAQPKPKKSGDRA